MCLKHYGIGQNIVKAYEGYMSNKTYEDRYYSFTYIKIRCIVTNY